MQLYCAQFIPEVDRRAGCDVVLRETARNGMRTRDVMPTPCKGRDLAALLAPDGPYALAPASQGSTGSAIPSALFDAVAAVGHCDAVYLADRALLDKLVTSERLSVQGLTVAAAATAQADHHVGSFTIIDTTAHVLSAMATLRADSRLSAVTLTDGGPLALGAADYYADHALIAKLAAGTVTVSGVAASLASKGAQDAHVAHLTVTDSLAHIGANLDALESLAKSGKLTGIAVADSGHTLTLSAAQISADHDAIALLSGNYHVAQAQSGLVIKLQYDSSMAHAPAAMKAALATAVQYFESLIATTETVTIKVGYGEAGGHSLTAGTLGEAAATSGVTVGYAAFEAALASHASSPAQHSAVAAMGSDPTHGSGIFVAGAEAKALGLMPTTASAADAAIGFAADAKGTVFDYDTNHRALSGLYDFLGVAEHEISHALGRIATLDVAHGVVTALDLFRYSAPGVHALDAGTTAYFSADGGTTNLGTYDTASDPADWAASAGNDADVAVAHPGVANLFTQADVTQLNVLGYALA